MQSFSFTFLFMTYFILYPCNTQATSFILFFSFLLYFLCTPSIPLKNYVTTCLLMSLSHITDSSTQWIPDAIVNSLLKLTSNACHFVEYIPNSCLVKHPIMLLLLSTPLHPRAASRVQHPKSCGSQQSLPPGGKERLHFVGIRPEVQARKGGW